MAVSSPEWRPVLWTDGVRVLVALPVPASAFKPLGKLVAILLGCQESRLQLVCGAERTAVAMAVGIAPDTAMLFAPKARR